MDAQYAQQHKPVIEQTEPVGHAVRAVYMYSAMADIAALTGERSYIKAIEPEGINIYNYGKKDKRVQQIVTKLSPMQQSIFKALELKKYLREKQPGLEFSVG